MSVLLANIADSLLPQLEGNSEQEKWETCARDFPWYPMAWLGLAKNGNAASKQKAAIWMQDEQRLHFLLTTNSFSQDVWLLKNFSGVEENTLTANILVEKQPAVQLEPNEIFLTEAEEKASVGDVIVSKEKDNFPQKFTLSGHFDEEEETADEEDANDTDFVSGSSPDELPLVIHSVQYNENELIGKIDRQFTATEEKKLPENVAVVREQYVTKSEVEIPEAAANTKLQKINDAAQPQSQSQPQSPSQPISAEPLAFEPYHVVDYFASQGIKVDINDLPKTQLDRQMKSFTQWLKTMKKVAPAQESTAATDPVVDAQATSSLIKEDVITEAMAEVLEKQGMYKKAIEVYEKLILLHPEKSTFFAARIKDLKSKQ